MVSILAVVLIAAALSACATASDATAPSDAPATLFVPANLSVSSVDGEAVRQEETGRGRERSLPVRPGVRNIVVEWLGENDTSVGQVELTKSFEPGQAYRLLRARTSVFLISGE